MFGNPKYTSNSFGMMFSRKPLIRREVNRFEDKLKDLYFPPQVVSVPDEFDPQVPRIVFNSRNGFSQILISQVSIVLVVNYSEDWQVDISKGEDYLLKRVHILFDLVNEIGDSCPYCSGLTTQVQLPIDVIDDNTDERIVGALKQFVSYLDTSNLYDIQLKLTEIVEDSFFSNLTFQNYRSWTMESPKNGLPRLSTKTAKEKGIQVIGDFNDRYAYNEKNQYCSTQDNAAFVIKKSIEKIVEAVQKIKEYSK